MFEKNEGDIQEVQHLTMEGLIYIPFLTLKTIIAILI